VVTVPLVLLAIPSLAIGYFTIQPMLFGDWFSGAIVVEASRDVVARLGAEFHGPAAFALHGFMTPAFWLAFAGFAAATFLYLLRPDLPPRVASALRPLVTVLEKKYWFDEAYQAVFARGSLLLGRGLWKGGDVAVIDEGIVNGSAALVGRISGIVRWIQSGYLYHYAFAMILGLIALLGAFVWSR
jgi:NADH-quinone oxidoreductase subunit L